MTMTTTTARPAPAGTQSPPSGEITRRGLLVYVLLGVFFGIVLVKSEVVSWFRIQEMFRFQAFHMYGVIGSAVLVAAGSLALIRKLGLRAAGGEPIIVPPKTWGNHGTRYWVGGTLFGLGWALTGACPGPLVALLGAGVWAILFAIVTAVAGAWVYGALRPHLPH